MTFVEFLPFLGVFLGLFVYFVGTDKGGFAESAIMALGGAVALISLAAVGAYFLDIIAVAPEQTCNIKIPDITIGQ